MKGTLQQRKRGLTPMTPSANLAVNNLSTMSLPTNSYDNDTNLYEGLRAGRTGAYDWLYTHLYPSYRFWVQNNNGSASDAEDAFQKGLISFVSNLTSGRYEYRAGAKVTTVIFDYCKKVWLTELDSARLRYRGAMPEQIDTPDSYDAIDELNRTELVGAVREALTELREGCRQLIQLFYIDEFSLREIAEQLSMKETSVKSKRYECTEQLKRIYLQIARKRGL
jgi:RNA polymerase sigma factor (sigma-70 family)